MTCGPFVAIDCPAEFGGLYVSGEYRIAHRVAGFGIDVCVVTHAGELLGEFAGMNALEKAQQICRDHAAGANVAPEVYMPGAGGGR